MIRKNAQKIYATKCQSWLYLDVWPRAIFSLYFTASSKNSVRAFLSTYWKQLLLFINIIKRCKSHGQCADTSLYLSHSRAEQTDPSRAPNTLGQLSSVGAPLLPSSLQHCPLLASLQIRASELKGLEPNSNQETHFREMKPREVMWHIQGHTADK